MDGIFFSTWTGSDSGGNLAASLSHLQVSNREFMPDWVSRVFHSSYCHSLGHYLDYCILVVLLKIKSKYLKCKLCCTTLHATIHCCCSSHMHMFDRILLCCSFQVRVTCQSPLCLCGSPQLILVLPFLFLFLFLQLGICPISGFEAAWNQRTSAIAVFWKL